MPQEDSIDRFIALPRDKQLDALKKLSPSDQDAVLGQVKERRGKKAASPGHGLGYQVGEAAKGAISGLKGAFVDPFIHPIDTVEGMGRSAMVGSTPYGTPLTAPTGDQKRDEANASVYGGVRNEQTEAAGTEMREHPVRTIASMAAPMIAGEAIVRGGGKVVDAVRGRGDPVSRLAYASGKGSADLVKQTLPEVSKIAQAEGEPHTVGEYLDTVQKAKTNLNEEYSHAIEPYEQKVVSTRPIVQKIRNLITSNMLKTASGKAEARSILRAAKDFDKPWTLKELDQERMDANARLTTYESKSPVDQYSTLKKSRSVAIDKAIADGVRENVYPLMDQLTGQPPGYFAELKQKIGNLLNLHSLVDEQVKSLRDTSARTRGAPILDRLNVRASVNSSGRPHGYLAGAKEALFPRNPEKLANKAVSNAFKSKKGPAPRLRDMPLEAIIGATATANSGNETDRWAGTHSNQQ